MLKTKKPKKWTIIDFIHSSNLTIITFLVLVFWIVIMGTFIKGWGLDLYFISRTILIFGGAFFVILVSRSFFKNKKIRKYLNNTYLIACILLILAFTLVGFKIVGDAYQINNQFSKELPHSQDVEGKPSSWITCNAKEDTFVESYDLSCISYLNHHNHSFKPIGIILRDGNQSDYLKFEINKENNVLFNIPVKEGKNKYHIEYRFNKNSNSETFYRRDIEFRAITEEIYFERIHQKNLLIFAVLSFSFFSVIAGMKYLKDIIEDEKK